MRPAFVIELKRDDQQGFYQLVYAGQSFHPDIANKPIKLDVDEEMKPEGPKLDIMLQ